MRAPLLAIRLAHNANPTWTQSSDVQCRHQGMRPAISTIMLLMIVLLCNMALPPESRLSVI